MKINLHHQHQPPLGTQRHQYLSCYWSHFNKTLKVGFWDQQQQHEQEEEEQQQQQYISCYRPNFDQTFKVNTHNNNNINPNVMM